MHLAKLLKAGGNMIWLDEPTNDLDVETLRALEDSILNYCDEGKINFFEGAYSDYEKCLKETLGDAATNPHSIKYKRIS